MPSGSGRPASSRSAPRAADTDTWSPWRDSPCADSNRYRGRGTAAQGRDERWECGGHLGALTSNGRPQRPRADTVRPSARRKQPRTRAFRAVPVRHRRCDVAAGGEHFVSVPLLHLLARELLEVLLRPDREELVRRVARPEILAAEETHRLRVPVGVLALDLRGHALLHLFEFGIGKRWVVHYVAEHFHRLLEVPLEARRGPGPGVVAALRVEVPADGVEERGNLLGRARLRAAREHLHRQVAQAVGLGVFGGEAAEAVHL